MDLRISVVIPVYNAERYVEAAITSALQFKEVKEVIVVDDAGPDNSLELCRGIAAKEPRVKVVQHPGGMNQGAGPSRNLGIRCSTEPFIAFLDADDTFLPNRFKAEARIFAEHPDADGVYGAVEAHFHDQGARVRYEQQFKSHLTTVRSQVASNKLFLGLVGLLPDFGHIHLNGLTVKREAMDRLHPWMRPELRLHQDTDFIIRLAWQAKLHGGIIGEPVALRGVHGDNRYIGNTRHHETNRTLYQVLWEWAKSANCPTEATAHLRYKYYLHDVGSGTKWHALTTGFNQRRYLRKFDFRDVVLQQLVGGVPKAKWFLHKVLWKIYQ